MAGATSLATSRLIAGPLRPGVDSARAVISVTEDSEGISVVRIPVPAAVRWDAVMTRRAARFDVTPGRHVQVIGKRTGTIDPAKDSVLVLAVQVSRRAPAGRSLGGTVEFTVGTVTARAVITLDVPVMHKLAMSLSAPSVVATRGEWTSLTVRVQNDGNVDERPALRVLPPTGWRVALRHDSRSGARPSAPQDQVPAGTSHDVSVRLHVPRHASSGVIMVPLSLTRADGTTQVEQVQVDVMAGVADAGNGVQMTTSMATGRGDGLEAATGYALNLSGNLGDSLRISGRLAYSGTAMQGVSSGLLLARTGMLTTPPTLELTHPRLQLSGGATYGTMPELAGQQLAGVGVIGQLSSRRLWLRGYQLNPLALSNIASLTARGPGLYRGAELGVATRNARPSVFAARLDDPITRRSLDAMGLRLSVGAAGERQWLTEVAWRDYQAGRGLGIATGVHHAGQRSTFDLRVLHAPGGSRAFARAVDDITLSASRSLGTRAYLSGGGWLQRDDNPLLGAAHNRGWFVTPGMSIPRLGTMGLEVRGLQFQSSVATNRLANTEFSGGGVFSTGVLGTSLIARSSLARIDRRLTEHGTPATGSSADAASLFGVQDSRQWRLDHSLTAMRYLGRGVLQANWNHQQFSGPSGLMPSQQSMQLRIDRVQPVMRVPLFLEGEVQRMQVGRIGGAFWSARTAASLELPIGMRITLAAERNPFLAMMGTGQRRPLLYTVRVDRTTMLPRLFTAARSRIFRDDNGNGRFDRGEAGVVGVIVKCGAQRVLTDKHGRFSCQDREQSVDVRSIPTGLVAATHRIEPGRELALRVMQPLHVSLRLSAADSARVSRDELSRAVVFARDSSGAMWYARANSDGRFVLDALPVGRYAIGVDATPLEEPLSMEGSEPSVVVDGTQSLAPVEVALRARPLRVRSFSPGATPVLLEPAGIPRDPRAHPRAHPRARPRSRPTPKRAATVTNGREPVRSKTSSPLGRP